MVSNFKEVLLSDKQLQFQRYDIPYATFNDFIRAILIGQLKNEEETKQPNVAEEVAGKVPIFEESLEIKKSQ